MGKGKEKEHQHQENYNNTDENKKWMHRETERQRRQEMAKLCASLRSLLPIEYIKYLFRERLKFETHYLASPNWRFLLLHIYLDENHQGRRSISDHMYEAVNYINYLQNKVKRLQDKRDELKKLCDLSSSTVEPTEDEGSSTHVPPYVVVHPLQAGGVEIMCSYSSKKCVFSLSSLLDIVIREGLNVVSSISTNKNGRSIHTIRSEDPNMMTGIDYSDLQRKLTEAISSSSLQGTNLSEPENCLLYLDS